MSMGPVKRIEMSLIARRQDGVSVWSKETVDLVEGVAMSSLSDPAQ